MSKLRRKNWRLSQVKTSSLARDTLSKIRLHVLALCVYPIEAESFSAASLQLSLDPLGNGRGRLYAVSPLIDPRAMQCWWAPIRVKQLSMAVIARVIWLCACVRYWPYRGAGTCASVHNLILLRHAGKGCSWSTRLLRWYLSERGERRLGSSQVLKKNKDCCSDTHQF